MSNPRPAYPKRLIEVDLPIARISTHARREKYLGTISSLHLWWARRPLAACRAVICAALWPDPADPLCPDAFRETARRLMKSWAADRGKVQGAESFPRFLQIQQKPSLLDDDPTLRQALLDFIADFANPDNSKLQEYLDTSRSLTQAGHESLGGVPGTRPLVVDPFAGGGSIPLEALRVGADAFASDINPVPVLLNKVVLEYIPKYGQRLVDEVRKWGERIKREAEKELADFYPKDTDGATPIAYLWARTIRCEGPGCGAEVPLIRSLWLAKRANRPAALQLVPNTKAKRVDFQIIVKQRGGWVDQDDPSTTIDNPIFEGTLKRSSATCPCCGYTTSGENVRTQFRGRFGGAADSRLLAVVVTRPGQRGREYRLPCSRDTKTLHKVAERYNELQSTPRFSSELIPNEPLPYLRSIFNIYLLDVKRWRDLFSPRQMLAMAAFNEGVTRTQQKLLENCDRDFSDAITTCLALAVSRQSDHLNSGCSWNPTGEKLQHLYSRQALGIIWDFCEANPFGDSVGNWTATISCCIDGLKAAQFDGLPGSSNQERAQKHPLPDDCAQALITDPPYYDAVPYADLSDFFYVWLKRSLKQVHPTLFAGQLTPKEGEIVQLAERNPTYSYKTKANFERLMSEALSEGRRITNPGGISIIVFAHKTTSAWETMLQAVVDAGWVIVASWPIDTELGTRLRAMNSATLSSSVHLVCRPRENPDGSVRTDEIGDWRDVLSELPRRIHEWMPRLAEEGVVGADAIFSCLGPALEIFSRYSRVEKVNGDVVPLREYLEHVWAAVSNEALSMIFKDADAAGLEPDARLTAMWLWTLGTTSPDTNGKVSAEEDTEDDIGAEDEEREKPSKVSGFVLEFDAARKIAQGLGIHLDKSPSVVEVKGDKARLLPVAERTKYLFGKAAVDAPTTKKKPQKKDTQLTLFEALKEVDADGSAEKPELKAPQPGSTVLDRVHQAMILFAAGRGEALKRFLVEEGIGKDARFWKLAQSLSALYPSGIDEKRWVDGVLARKKSLGL